VAQQNVPRGRLLRVVRLDDAQLAVGQTEVHPRRPPSALGGELECLRQFAREDGGSAL